MLIHFFKGNITHLTPRNISNYISHSGEEGFEKQLFLIANPSGILSNKDLNTYISLFKKTNSSCSYKIWVSSYEIIRIIFKIQKNDRIIFHSMIHPVTLRFLIYLVLYCRGLLSNTILVCWNLSDAIIQSDRLFIHIYNKIHYFFLKRFRQICLISKIDKEFFESKCKTNNAILLPLLTNGVKIQSVKYPKIGTDGTLRIMVSHSGWAHNNHIDSFRVLERFNTENIEIICPLCYGDEDYISRVVMEGQKMFGGKFKYFTELMPYDEYVDYLNTHVAIYVTSADIQTGLGAANILLRSGARLFVGQNLLDSYKSMGVKVDSVNILKRIIFDELKESVDDTLYRQNIEALSSFYDSNRIFEQYKSILK